MCKKVVLVYYCAKLLVFLFKPLWFFHKKELLGQNTFWLIMFLEQ